MPANCDVVWRLTDVRQPYTFDYGNRLRDAGGQESYRYDALGRRVLAWSSADQLNILSMYTRDGKLIYQDDQRSGVKHRYLYQGSQLVAVLDKTYSGGFQVRYQHGDAQGSIVAETNNNATPAIIERTVYSSWGAPLNHNNDDEPGYTGHLQDSLTGLTYMQQRYYDPVLERFLSTDPITPDANTGGNFNLYWYAQDNPIGMKIPMGVHQTMISSACPARDRILEEVLAVPCICRSHRLERQAFRK